MNLASGHTILPYDHAKLTFSAWFDGELRDGFTFALGQDAETVRADLQKRTAVVNVEIGRTKAIEQDDEAGFPDLRAWVHALDNCDSARRIAGRVVVLRAR